jgi:hypothetical protein
MDPDPESGGPKTRGSATLDFTLDTSCEARARCKAPVTPGALKKCTIAHTVILGKKHVWATKTKKMPLKYLLG